MNLRDFDGKNPFWALYCAKFCAAAYGDQVDKDLPAAARILCGDHVTIGTRDVESGVPAAIRIVGDEAMFVAVSGLTTVFQASQLSGSYVELGIPPSQRGFSSWVWNCANQLFRNLALERNGRGRDVIVTGHSAGGAIALALAAALRITFPHADVHCVTFGSPRAGTAASFPFLDSVETARWMNTGDDAVRLPPRLLDLTDLSFLAHALLVPLWARFVHCAGGLVLNAQGVIEGRQEPPIDHLLGAATFPLSYLRDGELFGTAHAIAEYIARLLKSIPPKIAQPFGKPVAKFSLEPLPAMFQALTTEIPMPFPTNRPAGVEIGLTNPPIEFQVEYRQAEIAQPIRRC